MSVTFVVVSVVLLCFRPIFPFSAFVLSFHFLLFNHFFSSGDSIQVHCVDLGESFPTSIYLQKSASIQPRTSPSKFGEKFNSLFTSLLRLYRSAGARALQRLQTSPTVRGELL